MSPPRPADPRRGQRCARLGVSLDGRARSCGSLHCLIWGSGLRKVRSVVPSDLFKGLAASRLPPTPFRLHPLRRPVSPHSFPFTGFDCLTARSERREQLFSSRPSLLVFLSRGGGGGRESAGLCGRFANCVRGLRGQRLPEVLWGARRDHRRPHPDTMVVAAFVYSEAHAVFLNARNKIIQPRAFHLKIPAFGTAT